MKRIVIHIGTHKTGTTSIQDALERNRSQLAARSIWYARTDREPLVHLAKHASLTRALIKGGEDAKAELRLLLSEFEESKCQTLVLSAEGLCELNAKALAPLRDLSSGFDVRVVCFFRRPDYFVEALWNQYCREGREKRRILAFSRAERVLARTRYAALLDTWSEVGTTRPANFDTAKRRGLLKLFSELADIDLPPDMELHGNPSPSMNCAAALSMLNASGAEYDLQNIIAAFEGDDRRLALGARRRAKLLQDASEELTRLEREYGVAFDTDMPDEPNEPLQLPDVPALIAALAVLGRSRPPEKPRTRLSSILMGRLPGHD